MWDRNGFLKRILNDENILQAVVQEFLKDIPQQLVLLENALAANDRDAIKALAHRIKGGSGNVGGMSLSGVSTILQDEALSGSDQRVRTLVEQMGAEFERLRAAMLM